MTTSHRAAAMARLVAAVALVAWACRPEGPWLASMVGAALVWPDLARGSGPRPAATAALLLAPVPASAFEGLRVHDPAAWAAVAVGWSVAYGAVGALGGRVVGRTFAPSARPVGWAAAWAALDAAVVHGAPFVSALPVTPGYLLLDGPLVAWAAVGGPVALGVAWALLGAALAAVVGRFGVAPGGTAAGAAWGAVALALVGGAHAWSAAATRAPTVPSRTVAVAHGVGGEAALAATRTDPDAAAGIVAALLERARASPAVDLHVWPESALGYVAPEGLPGLVEVARALGAPVLAGGYRPDADGGWRNSVVFATTAAATWAVDKRHLVPRYEAWLTAGVGERWPVRVAGRRWGVLLCWESLHLGAALERARAADVLLVLTHDGWAGATATPWWHARSGRLLAWSTGKPVVVASHDGPSMAWSHDGRLLGSAAGTEVGLAVALDPPERWTTPYARFGPRGVAAAVAAAWAVLLATVVARHAVAVDGRQGCGASGPQAA